MPRKAISKERSPEPHPSNSAPAIDIKRTRSVDPIPAFALRCEKNPPQFSKPFGANVCPPGDQTVPREEQPDALLELAALRQHCNQILRGQEAEKSSKDEETIEQQPVRDHEQSLISSSQLVPIAPDAQPSSRGVLPGGHSSLVEKRPNSRALKPLDTSRMQGVSRRPQHADTFCKETEEVTSLPSSKRVVLLERTAVSPKSGTSTHEDQKASLFNSSSVERKRRKAKPVVDLNFGGGRVPKRIGSRNARALSETASQQTGSEEQGSLSRALSGSVILKKQFRRAKGSFASEFEFNGRNERLEFDETLGRMVSTDDLNSQKEVSSPNPFFNRRLASKNQDKPIFPYVARRRPSLTSPGTQ